VSYSPPLTAEEIKNKITNILIISKVEEEAEEMFAKEDQTASAMKLILMNFKNIPDLTSREAIRKQLWIMIQVGKWFSKDETEINRRIINAFSSLKVQESNTWLREQNKQAKREFNQEEQTISALQLIIIYYKECSRGVQVDQVWIERQAGRLVKKSSSMTDVKLIAACLPNSQIGLEAQKKLDRRLKKN